MWWFLACGVEYGFPAPNPVVYPPSRPPPLDHDSASDDWRPPLGVTRDLLLIVDDSGSMGPDRWKLVSNVKQVADPILATASDVSTRAPPLLRFSATVRSSCESPAFVSRRSFRLRKRSRRSCWRRSLGSAAGAAWG